MSSERVEPPVDGLREVPSSLVPPPELEERVVAALSQQGLLPHRRSTVRGTGHRALLAAALVGAFVGGSLLGLVLAPRLPATASPDRLYALLLYQNAGNAEDAAHEPERVAEYRRWLASLRDGGRFADGERLANERRILAPEGADGVPGPESPAAAGALAGFFLIEARSDEEALGIARDCPHLRHGGTVELRRVDRGP